MSLSALDAVDDAYRATGAFLRPVDRTRWAKLALIGLFVGLPTANAGGAQFGGAGAEAPANGGPGGMPVDGGPVDVPVEAWIAIAVAVVVAVALALALVLVGSVMEFVLVESLREEDVQIRAYWRRYFRRGLRLFGFRLLLGLAVLAALALLAALVFVPLALGDAVASTALLAILLIPAFLAIVFVAAVVGGFTTAFVVPVMIAEDCGVIAGWRRFWPTLTGQWTEYLAYAVLAFVLGIVGSALVGVVTAILAVLLLIPFGVLAALAFGLFVLAEPVGIAAFVVVGLLFALAVIAVAALVQVPVITYLRYYALLVLGDTNERFDLIPDQRAAVRD
ncbi:hypothetical protein ACFQMA_12805 [Halosimplex aquaticum]|uniref:Membrane-anchored glycerophosphoryl diester phosphodiesterase (GDPDase), membrane domain n=1 Tax=Halosimplex aquaticum TaxID=3026162 RepID=A0ABD5Y5S0_9EURY|nr:hypothetical protein [Halosimplex aquaticum]